MFWVVRMPKKLIVKFYNRNEHIVTKVVIRYGPVVLPPIDALWDTGATQTLVAEEIIDGLHIPPQGKSNMSILSGINQYSEHLLDIFLSDDLPFIAQRVLRAPVAHQGYGVVIGMDIISQGHFHIILDDEGKTFEYEYK